MQDCVRVGLRQYQAAHQQESAARVRLWMVAHPDKAGEYRRSAYARVRAAVFDHYGRTCACCGGTDRPTIDHINGDGAEHRRMLRSNDPSKVYRWLIRQGFPAGFQTLCLPCNQSKGTGTRCRIDHPGLAA